jgi:DNA-binding transcriptional ArsR family regulator
MSSKKTNDFAEISDSMFPLIAGCFQALADPTRLKILRALRGGARTVHDLVQMFEWTQPNISRHLSVLARSGLVTKSKQGMFVYYSIANPKIFSLCDNVCDHIGDMLATYERPVGKKRK